MKKGSPRAALCSIARAFSCQCRARATSTAPRASARSPDRSRSIHRFPKRRRLVRCCLRPDRAGRESLRPRDPQRRHGRPPSRPRGGARLHLADPAWRLPSRRAIPRRPPHRRRPSRRVPRSIRQDRRPRRWQPRWPRPCPRLAPHRRAITARGTRTERIKQAVFPKLRAARARNFTARRPLIERSGQRRGIDYMAPGKYYGRRNSR